MPGKPHNLDHKLNSIRRAYADMDQQVCGIDGFVCCSGCRLPVSQCICEPSCMQAMRLDELSTDMLATHLFDLYAERAVGLSALDAYIVLLASARLRCCAELHGGF